MRKCGIAVKKKHKININLSFHQLTPDAKPQNVSSNIYYKLLKSIMLYDENIYEGDSQRPSLLDEFSSFNKTSQFQELSEYSKAKVALKMHHLERELRGMSFLEIEALLLGMLEFSKIRVFYDVFKETNLLKSREDFLREEDLL